MKYFPWWVSAGAVLTLTVVTLLSVWDVVTAGSFVLVAPWISAIYTWHRDARVRLGELPDADAAALVRDIHRREIGVAAAYSLLLIGLAPLITQLMRHAQAEGVDSFQLWLGTASTLLGGIALTIPVRAGMRRRAIEGKSATTDSPASAG